MNEEKYKLTFIRTPIGEKPGSPRGIEIKGYYYSVSEEGELRLKDARESAFKTLVKIVEQIKPNAVELTVKLEQE